MTVDDSEKHNLSYTENFWSIASFCFRLSLTVNRHRSPLTNPRKIANTMEAVHGTTSCDAMADRYIGYAEEAFVFTRVKRYNVKEGKEILVQRKTCNF